MLLSINLGFVCIIAFSFSNNLTKEVFLASIYK